MPASTDGTGSDDPQEGSPDPALELCNVAKTFASRTVLNIGRLTIATGEVHALLGQNGSGKSTLIKILSGYHAPDGGLDTSIRIAGDETFVGSVDRSRHAGIRFVHQDLGLVHDLSVLDNIYLGRRYPTRWGTVQHRRARVAAREALELVGLGDADLDARVASISPAERTGVAIARALAEDGDHAPTLLVLDEPTATLPAPEIDRLMLTLRGVVESGIAILYVTHHLDEVFRIASSVTVLRDGEIVGSGLTSTLTHADIVHHLIGRELEEVHRSNHAPSPQQTRSDVALRVTDLRAERVEPVSFAVAPGEVVGLYGVTGSGRDAILGAVFGALPCDGGTIRIGDDDLPPGRPDLAIALGVGFVPADRGALGCFLGLSATENLTLPDVRAFWRSGRIDRRAEESAATDWFARLDIRPQSGRGLPLSMFSGGNQQKVILAKWLRQHPRVLLLDEPTQGVDVGAKAGIHRTILEAVATGLAVLIASSDDQELAALCSRVHIIHRGRIVDTLVDDEISETALRRRQNTASHTTTVVEGARP